MTPLTCKICKAVFASGTNLNQHRRQVHEQVKPCQCEVCGKIFSRRSNLMRHVKNHTSAPPTSPPVTGVKRTASAPNSSPAAKKRLTKNQNKKELLDSLVSEIADVYVLVIVWVLEKLFLEVMKGANKTTSDIYQTEEKKNPLETEILREA